VETKFGSCMYCGKEESFDCPLYLCQDKNELLVICCIVYVINNSLLILKKMDGLLDED